VKSSVASFHIRPTDENDIVWIADFLRQQWGSTRVVTRGRIHYAEQLAGFVPIQEGKPVGLLTFRIEDDGCEIVTLNSLLNGTGIGSSLIEAAKAAALSAKCCRIWAVTTNDNTDALRFYQKRGFAIVAVHQNAIEESRKLKPEIPVVGFHGIPVRDEIELEFRL
jgi:N-acetylglutamate synthase-like GNAT family acetyltransferase